MSSVSIGDIIGLISLRDVWFFGSEKEIETISGKLEAASYKTTARMIIKLNTFHWVRFVLGEEQKKER